MSDIQSVLDLLQDFSEKNTIQIFIPSLNREVGFKLITGAQQKRIYETGYDNVVFRTKFIIATYDIIVENCLEPDITNEFNVIDRLSILLSYRKALYGSAFESSFGKSDISESIERVKTSGNRVTEQQFEYNGIKVTTQIPKIDNKYKFEKELREQTVLEKKEVKNFIQAFGEMYIGEVCKTIKTLIVADNVIDFKQLNVQEQIAIVEKLPVQIVNLIGSYIKTIIALQTDILTVKAIKEDVETDIMINIDTEFLISG